MKFYALLAAATVLVLFISWALWHKTKSVSFPVGSALLYYWTLLGAWQVISDKMGPGANNNYTYYYFETKLFPIALDSSYFTALILYSLFIVIVLLTALGTAQPAQMRPAQGPPLRMAHSRLLMLSAFALALSYALVQQGLSLADSKNLSGYAQMRGAGVDSPWFTLHQLLSRLALFGIGLGLATYFSGLHAQRVAGKRSGLILVGYLLLAALALVFLAALGDRQELLFVGLTSVLFYIANCPRYRVFVVSCAALTLLATVGIIASIRGSSFRETPDAIKALDLSTVMDSVTRSNEQFAAHFSMYGSLRYDVPLTHGSSFEYLAISVVPRFLYSTRPAGIYEHYVHYTNATPGQGYTIHHATAWYLNFGIPGVVVGAIVFGWIWGKTFNLHQRDSATRSRLFRAATCILPWSFTGYIPVLLRTGVEGYKGFALEALLIPTLVIAISVTGHAAVPRYVMAPAHRWQHVP